ncbi:calcium-binding protein [Microvirga terrestris]|uniref:Cadherin domain-containing protein n=1 Tax=Microvirga terrestris TaxID=2791024 RepID=A0ABS0HUP8_9HYPH|nr:calcium-binding protein [Microvirga terrestris]MBF9197231.1 hypothetical protein [Microvirga terrestris]
MARSFLYTDTVSWEELFSGAFTIASSSDTSFIVNKTINGINCSIAYTGSALLGDNPVINEVLVTNRQTGTHLASIVRYWEGENDLDITRSIQDLQSGGFASFAHLMASEDWSVQIGSDQGDIIIGVSSEFESLNGRAGNDTLTGGVGDDMMSGDEGFDYASYETASAGVFASMDDWPDRNTGEAYNDRFYSVEGLIGSAHNDHFIGDRFGNHLLGGDGNDTLGGSRFPSIDPDDDTLDGGSDIDTAQFLFNRADYDIVHVGGGYWRVTNRTAERDWTSLITNIEFLQFADGVIPAPTGPGPIYGTPNADTITGTSGADTIYGYGRDSTTDVGDTLNGAGGNDTIYGGAGNDTVDGGTHNDHLYGDADNDDISGNAGNDTIYGGTGDDTLFGGQDDDRLYGDAGNDTLAGDSGADTLEGGSGNDIYYVDSNDSIIETSTTDNDEVRAEVSFTLQAGQAIEKLSLSGSADIDLTGNEVSQTLVGNLGDNRLDGGSGQDSLRGGGGNDTYVVDGDDTIIETLNGGRDTVQSKLDFSLENHQFLEDLVLLQGATKGTGNGLDNDITGNDAANTLDGGSGQDSLRGGGGNDTYWIDSAGDEIFEDDGKGTDTLIASVSYDLTDAAHVEILQAADGTTTIDLTGNQNANILRGNKGKNILNGEGGNDTVVLTGKLSDYTVERGLGGAIIITEKDNKNDQDAIYNVEFFQFSDRTVSSDGLLNTPPSGLKLEGDAVYENSEKGQFIGNFSVTDNSGDTHTFALTNSAGGRFSIDPDGTLRVADGVRLDYEQSTLHTIEVTATDSFGESITRSFVIRIQDSLDERATGSAGADVMKGGNGSDSFNGLAGNDRIEAGLGNDTLMGGSENDTLDAGGSNDRLSGETGNDWLLGGLGNDTAEGGSGNDMLNGGAGNDQLIGGLGKDTLTGSTGRDVFAFDDRETGSSKSKADYITDFSGRAGDRIDLKLVDADTKKGGDQRFSFIGKEAFTKAGQVRYEKTKKETYVYLNTDSDKAAEAVIKLKGSIDLSKGWFVL